MKLDLRRETRATGPTALYRCFDEDGWLLYIGTSLDPKRRFREHAKWFGWWPAVVRIDVEWLPYGFPRSMKTEHAAIWRERPACNAEPRVVVEECGPPMEGGTWFDRGAQLREWRRWFAVWRDCRLQPEEVAWKSAAQHLDDRVPQA
ncbi:GIY-YIG nuclease family protein [Kitasatospora sp. NPDC048545]|uniref:GIY-YIG nuclease family protein n=1 Tax=Kitasatospora sp. NPDC048545 TaxID=3157208 RepID=UPI0033CC385F